MFLSKYPFIVLFFVLSNVFAYAQTTLSGVLKDKDGNLLSDVTVVIYDFEDNILGYSVTETDGIYKVKFNSSLKESKLEIKSLFYETISEIIPNISSTKNYILQTKINELKEVIVEEKITIRKIGDTLSYNVSSFASEKDRTIKDVLSKMPGIEILKDGKVLYQGKPISNYYIDGLDLLEGKYNLANNNLPYDQVSKVQILENHQPIRILDSISFSDNVALNIKLKNGISFTGQTELGAGASPFLYEGNVTPMLFAKNKQMLFSYQSNNIGKNLKNQVKTLTIEDLKFNSEDSNEKKEWLSLQLLSTPSFSENRWVDNQSHLLSGNYLHKTKKFLIKTNIAYVNDYQKQTGSTNTRFFTATDTIQFLENIENRLFTNNLESNIILERNDSQKYFKNTFQFNGFWDSQEGNLNQNNNRVSQQLSNHFFTLNNHFKNIFKVNKQLFTIYSSLSYKKIPQNILVSPGQFDELLNNGVPYENVSQSIENNKFFSNTSLGFSKKIKAINFNQTMGVQYENETLESNLKTNNVLLEDILFQNNLNWHKLKTYLSSQVQYKVESWHFLASLPINYLNFNWNNVQNSGSNVSGIFIEPRVSISNDLTNFWNFSVNYNRNYRFGSVNQLFDGFVLTNYRNIKRYESVLPQSKNDNYSVGINYRNPVNSWFGSLMYIFLNTKKNIVSSSNINELGATEIQTIQLNNERTNHVVTCKISKYFSDISSTFSFNSSYVNTSFFQLVNQNFNKISNRSSFVETKVNSQILSWLEIDLQSSFLFSNNSIQGISNSTNINQLHGVNLNFFPKENQYVALKTEFLYNNTFTNIISSNFLDLLYRYTLKSKNIDFEFQLNNLLNSKEYTTVSVTEFSYIQTNFQLRPRQFFFKIRFSL